MSIKAKNTFIYFSIISISFSLLFCSEEIKEKKFENVDPVESFKEYISNHLDSYKKDKRGRITLLSGGWANLQYEPEDIYKIDVQKTNSLVTPYTGFCEFTLNRRFTTFHKSKEDAANDTVFIKTITLIHRHHYGFQENRWITTSREHKLISSAMDFDWNSCDEILQEGEQKGLSNLHGCWEK